MAFVRLLATNPSVADRRWGQLRTLARSSVRRAGMQLTRALFAFLSPNRSPPSIGHKTAEALVFTRGMQTNLPFSIPPTPQLTRCPSIILRAVELMLRVIANGRVSKHRADDGICRFRERVTRGNRIENRVPSSSCSSRALSPIQFDADLHSNGGVT